LNKRGADVETKRHPLTQKPGY